MGIANLLRPKPKPDPVIRHLQLLAEEIGHLRTEQRALARELLERIGRIMATVADLRDALRQMNDAVTAELEQIRQVIQQAGVIPQDVIDDINAATQRIENFVDVEEIPIPEPGPNPEPAPAPPDSRKRQ